MKRLRRYDTQRNIWQRKKRQEGESHEVFEGVMEMHPVPPLLLIDEFERVIQTYGWNGCVEDKKDDEHTIHE